MTMTPAIKGLLTKAAKSASTTQDRFNAVRAVFLKRGMPREQSKHATRQYLTAI